MQITFKTITAASMLVAASALAGCATNGDIEELRAEIAKVNTTANQAAADAASAKADTAAAKAAAEEARDTAQDTNEKLDRMFKKSMYK
jgi:murein lipoprotein